MTKLLSLPESCCLSGDTWEGCLSWDIIEIGIKRRILLWDCWVLDLGYFLLIRLLTKIYCLLAQFEISLEMHWLLKRLKAKMDCKNDIILHLIFNFCISCQQELFMIDERLNIYKIKRIYLEKYEPFWVLNTHTCVFWYIKYAQSQSLSSIGVCWIVEWDSWKYFGPSLKFGEFWILPLRLSNFLLIISFNESHVVLFSFVSHRVFIVPLDIVAIILQLLVSLSNVLSANTLLTVKKSNKLKAKTLSLWLSFTERSMLVFGFYLQTWIFHGIILLNLVPFVLMMVDELKNRTDSCNKIIISRKV